MSKSVPDRTEKIMSITLQEFEAGLGRIDGQSAAPTPPGVYENSNGAVITFEKLEPVVLGGLMRLPRARVTIDVTCLESETRQRFLAHFDQTFQRGGG
jgi:hypothetical protein